MAIYHFSTFLAFCLAYFWQQQPFAVDFAWKDELAQRCATAARQAGKAVVVVLNVGSPKAPPNVGRTSSFFV